VLFLGDSLEGIKCFNNKYEKLPSSKTIQFLLYINLLAYPFDAFFGSPLRKLLLVATSLVFALLCLWYMKEKLTWGDLIFGSVLMLGLLYYRYGSQKEYKYVSLLYNAPIPILGFCLGLVMKYMKLPRGPLLLYVVLAQLPFLYAFWFLNIDLNETGLFFTINRNTISRLLVISTAIQVMGDSVNKRKYIVMFPSILTVLCSYYSYSRAGIIVSIYLFLIVLFYNVKSFASSYRIPNQKNSIKPVIVSVIIILLAFLFIVYIYLNSRLSTIGFKDTGRYMIYSSFFNQLTIPRLLFGFYPTIPGNLHLHNSFLSIISYFGVFSLGIFALLGISFIHYSKRSFILANLVILWCVYSLVESISPLDLGDLLAIPLIMLALSDRSKQKLNFANPYQFLKSLANKRQ